LCVRDSSAYIFFSRAFSFSRSFVGEAALDGPAKAYLEFLQREFALPVEYRQFDMKNRRLA
jgi:hypothetical protein